MFRTLYIMINKPLLLQVKLQLFHIHGGATIDFQKNSSVATLYYMVSYANQNTHQNKL